MEFVLGLNVAALGLISATKLLVVTKFENRLQRF